MNVPEKDGNLNEDKSINVEKDVKVPDKFLRYLSFCERMKRLSSNGRSNEG